MTSDLEGVFGELGLAQYLHAFVDQGFDSWNTILDIQESDLDALGVKLGHRRKLQRRIANARGIAPSVSLASSIKYAVDEAKQNGNNRREVPRPEATVENNGVAKRKYRRHPKPDENSPERPPSAYVLFSNKMRDDLKSQNLTFTEIAKLVGENWQSLPQTEREVYENQANTAKEKYHRDLAEYKKTPEYRKYAQYLLDFKEKQAKQNQTTDLSKRTKVEPGRLRHGSSSSSATPGGATTSGSGSSSERLQESEPPTTRHTRGDSTASRADSQNSSIGAGFHSQRNSVDEAGPSPRSCQFEIDNSGDPRQQHHCQSSWNDKDMTRESGQHHLPSLSDMLEDGRKRAPESLNNASAYSRIQKRRALPDTSISRPFASLRHEASSSSSSGVSALPIHALLSSRDSDPRSVESAATSPSPNPVDHRVHRPALGNGINSYCFQSGPPAFQNVKTEPPRDDIIMANAPNSGKTLDGMNALLRAGEIVSRGARR